MDSTPWQEDIGSIRFVDNNQCVWVAPSLLLDEESCVTSPKFFLEGMKWRITKKKKWLLLRSEDRHKLSPACYATLSVKGAYGRNGWYCKGSFYHGFGDQLLEKSNKLLDHNVAEVRHGCISILCKIEKNENNSVDEHTLFSNEVLKTDSTSDTSSDSEEEEGPKGTAVKGLERLAQNLKNLFMDGQNSDVTLKAGNREFPVHKLILGARSPVFDAMFQMDMKEKTGGVVDIPDCTAESFEVFLIYLYTGSAETMSSDSVSDLYYAADKYRVDDLKEDCVQFMRDNMTVENVCDVVALALRHSETGLLKDATDFFRRNIKRIIKTVQWQTYMQENSTHASELLVQALDA